MASARLGLALSQIQYLFCEGSWTGISDTQLLKRFAAGRDELAFAALLDRHGPMVMTVCLGVLRDSSAAEDAFQATFLVFARKADSVWAEGQLGGWLHTVAHRIAVRRRWRRLEAASSSVGRHGTWCQIPLASSSMTTSFRLCTKRSLGYLRNIGCRSCFVISKDGHTRGRRSSCDAARQHSRRRLAGARERLATGWPSEALRRLPRRKAARWRATCMRRFLWLVHSRRSER